MHRMRRPPPADRPVQTEGQDSMVSRVYVEKKPGFDVEAQQLLAELRDTPLFLSLLEID